MNKAYNRINDGKGWKNHPSDETPLNAYNLNKSDVALDEIDNRVIILDNTKATKIEISELFNNVSFDEQTGIITFTRKNGATVTIDTPMEKIALNIYYDPVTEMLTLPLIDGTQMQVDLSRLITEYEFMDSDTIAFSVNTDGKVTAIVKEGSIEEKHLRPDYLADIKVEVAKAQASQQAAATSESNAKKSETAAKESQTAAKASETNAASHEESAADSAKNAARSSASADDSARMAITKANEAFASSASAAGSEKTAVNKANEASASAASAAESKANADMYAKKTQSYAVGSGGVRPDEASDNAKTYYEKSKEIYESFSSSGDVTGVKGDAEAAYRSGLVNLTANNIGALSLDGGQMSDNAEVRLKSSSINTYDRYLSIDGSKIRFEADDNGRIYSSVFNEEGVLIENTDGPDNVTITAIGAYFYGYDNSSTRILSSETIMNSFDDNGSKYFKKITAKGEQIHDSIGNNYYNSVDIKTDFYDNEYSINTYLEGNSANITFYSGDITLYGEYGVNVNSYDSGFAIGDGTSLKALRPKKDSVSALGAPAFRWRDIYAANGVIQTSDRAKKTDIENLTDDKAKEFIMGLTPVSYKMTDGASGRTHYGLIAQDVEDLMTELGMDSKDFAGFIKSPKVIKKDTDANGNPLKRPAEETIEGQYDYALRYDEFIAPLIKMVQKQQKEIDRLKEKLIPILY